MNAKGTVFRYGDDVDTDVIIPARYLNTSDPKELASHCMEDIDKDFVKNVRDGDIIVADDNFGCGSSREHAPIAIKESGVSCVIASSFARIFYRNAINIGLPIIECPEASEQIQEGDEVSVDVDTGVVTNLTRNETYLGEPFPPFIQGIIASGGLMNAIRAVQWLHLHPETPADKAARIKAQMLAAFYTDTDAWKGQITSQARQSMFQAVNGLTA